MKTAYTILHLKCGQLAHGRVAFNGRKHVSLAYSNRCSPLAYYISSEQGSQPAGMFSHI